MGVEERWDVLDVQGAPLGMTKARSEPRLDGEYQLIVHVWIVDRARNFLIQRRAEHLAWWGGRWACTGGMVSAGEESRAAAVREVAEELGLHVDPAALRLLVRLPTRDQLEDIWEIEVDRDALGELSLGEEVMDYRWATAEEVKGMIEKGEYFRYSYAIALLNGDPPNSFPAPE